MGRIYLSPPHMSPLERDLLLDAFDSNWIAPIGPHVDAFERQLADYVGVSDAAALSSGTAGLHLALVLLDVRPGDIVAVSDLTFSASANVVRYVGATPVFIDSDLQTWNMDPDVLADALTTMSRRGRLPKACIVVDLYGQCADYDRLLKVCAQYDVPVIQDASEALGATCRDVPAGAQGEIGIFSFNGNKIITTSGGGALVSKRPELVERARFLASQARDPAPHYEHSSIGYNYRMSNLLAAVGCGQLHVLDERVAARREVFERYASGLMGYDQLKWMPEAGYGRSTRWLTCATIDTAARRDDMIAALSRQDIEARPVWKPMHLQPIFRECSFFGSGVSSELFRVGICLPSGSSLSRDAQVRVISLLKEQCEVRR